VVYVCVYGVHYGTTGLLRLGYAFGVRDFYVCIGFTDNANF